MLRKTLPALGYWLGCLGAARREDGAARVIMFHGTPRRHARRFERMLRYLRNQFDIVPLPEIVDRAAAGGANLRRKVALTFDDGLRSNIDIAYPILKRLGIPATFFICPGLVERHAWLWNHEARQRLHRLAPPQRRDIGGVLGCDAEVEAIIDRMKTLGPAARREAEQRIRAATPDFSPTPAEQHEFDLAGWNELRHLDPAIITIGAHTMTHPILPTLEAAEIVREVIDSRAALERKLGREVDLFAYPNGDVNAQTLECVRGHFRAAVSVEQGTVAAGTDLHFLPRIAACSSWGALKLALAMHRDTQPVKARDYFFVTPISVSGSQVASSGNKVISAMHTTIMKKNGSEASAT